MPLHRLTFYSDNRPVPRRKQGKLTKKDKQRLQVPRSVPPTAIVWYPPDEPQW
jgi:hypothetical protein